ncbi:MAG: 50S ribosomal protein L35ae [Candidatus Altiarchaeales archaeon]|nr:50S ribosomal protein L35ae [Candidatus Altiarchaeales archaeon]MBD3416690.1 50S ribosomal protein L35ae [Candidatus Altiarchaeales archaeon]
MDAVIVNYRRGRRTQNTNQMILQPKDSKSKDDAEKLVGKTVEWTTSSGKKMAGKVSKPHGSKGAVLAQFNPGLPGQAVGTKAEIK